MNGLEKRLIEAGLKRNSESYADYEKAKKLIKEEDYVAAVYFIAEYFNV